MEATGQRDQTHRNLGWLAHACLLVASIGLFIASAIWTNQVLLFDGIPLMIAVFAWAFPAPAGILSILFGLYQFGRYDLYSLTLPFRPLPGMIETPPEVSFIPQGIFYLLYGVFILGGAIHLFLGIRDLRRIPTLASKSDKTIRMAAWTSSLGALLATIVVFFTIDEAAVAFHFTVWAIVALGIARFWPGAGGTLIVLVGGWSLYALLAQGLWPETELLYSLLFSVFSLGGILFLTLALRARALRREINRTATT